MGGLGKNFRERVAAQLERDKRDGRGMEEDERRFLIRFRQTARAGATTARKGVRTAFEGVLRRKHPGTDWTVVEPKDDSDSDANTEKKPEK